MIIFRLHSENSVRIIIYFIQILIFIELKMISLVKNLITIISNFKCNGF